MTEELWTYRQCAEHLQINEHSLRAWVHKGTAPPHIKLGKLVRFRPDTVKQWLAQKESETNS